ncbi:GIY-YIG nuclease family protein [Candidatus Daviesbacteria bacterium]|nr:GIY-YIG nuclease family protein [Candidatus Daviesbacteria bacterium]
MFYVYSIYNKKHCKIYIGQTDNLDQRIKLHNDKEFRNSYTAKFDGEWVFLYKEECETRQAALIRERQLKSYRGRQFIKNLIHSPVAQR